MIKIVSTIICTLFLSLGTCFAGMPTGIIFESAGFSEVLHKARKERKLVFIDIYADWCGSCKKMEREVFTQKKVGDYFNTHFINLKIDAEKGNGPRIAARYDVRSYPTFLVVDGNGQLIGKMIGGSPADHFIETIEKIRRNDPLNR